MKRQEFELDNDQLIIGSLMDFCTLTGKCRLCACKIGYLFCKSHWYKYITFLTPQQEIKLKTNRS